MNSIEAELLDIRDAIVCTRERIKTREHLDQACWRIWGYCNANAGAMDSEGHCRSIRQIIEGAVADIQSRLDDEVRAREQLKRRLLQSRKKTEEAEHERDAAYVRIEKLEDVAEVLAEKKDVIRQIRAELKMEKKKNIPLSDRAKATARRLGAT